MAHQKSYLCIGAPDMALDLIHHVRPIGHSAQMQPLKYHFILSEGSYDTRSNRKWEHTGGSSRSWCSLPTHLSCHNLGSRTEYPEMSFAVLSILLVRTRSVLPSMSRITFGNFSDVKRSSSVKKFSPLPVDTNTIFACSENDRHKTATLSHSYVITWQSPARARQLAPN